MVRRGWGAALALGVALASSGAAPSGAAAADKVTVALNWVPGGDHAAMYYAKKLGWYQDAGIDLNLEAGKGSAGSLQRVSTNLAPYALVDMGVFLTGRGKGANAVAVFDIYANTALGMYWLKSSGITGVKDFPGKRIGVPAGDAQRALFPALAKKNGIDPNSVTWVNVDPNGKLPALKAKAIDVTTNFYNLHHIMSRELGDDMGFLSWAKAGINPYGLAMMVNGDYLAQHRDAVAKFVKVTQKAYAECVKSPKPCVEALVESVGALRLDNELVNWQLTQVLMSDEVSRGTALGWMDPKRMAEDYELVKTYLGLDQPYDVKTAFTNDFLDTSIKMVAVPEPKFN